MSDILYVKVSGDRKYVMGKDKHNWVWVMVHLNKQMNVS